MLKTGLPIAVFATAFVVLSLGLHPKQLSHSDETFYLLSAREMQATGDYLTPKIEGLKRFQKPIFFYWAVAAANGIGGNTLYAGRFASIFFAALTIAFLFFAIRRWRGIALAGVVSLALASSYGFFAQSHYAMTDITLNFFVTLALLFYWEVHTHQKQNTYYKWGIFAAIALACLTKGPLGLGIPLLTILIYSLMTRNPKALKPLFTPSGWWIGLCIALPWFIVMWRIHGDAYSSFLFGREIATRMASNERSMFYL
ncbi:ArnT family glycosyltransferase, partial [Bdellovibrionota bacterium]